MEIKLPGQELERAAGEVTSHAGKSLVNILGDYFKSFLAEGISRREALARRSASRIEHQTDVERQKLDDENRRKRELVEREHRAGLEISDLRLERAIARVRSELEQEQENIEYIAIEAIKKAEKIESDAEIRDVEVDWIRTFFKYAKDVNDRTVRDIFADILANASIASRTLIPLKSLDIIRFMNKDTANEFVAVSKVIAKYSFLTEQYASTMAKNGNIKRNTLEMLEEAGLLKRFFVYSTNLQIGAFMFSISLDIGSTYRFDVYKFTQAGASIIDILSDDVRRANEARGDPLRTEELWAAQRNLGLSPKEFGSFSRHIISEISDAQNVSIMITGRVGNSFRTITTVEKRDTYDPFQIRLDDEDLKSYAADNAQFVRVFEGEFQDYDEKTLPAMGRRDRAKVILRGEEIAAKDLHDQTPVVDSEGDGRISSRQVFESEVPIESAALSAGARARVILRGKRIAAEDLSESGGAYTLEEARRLLNGISRQSVERRVREGSLLAVPGPNNKRLYPVVQFADDGSVVDGLQAVLKALPTDNGFAILNFLVNPCSQLDDAKPIDLLKKGEGQLVVEAARRYGEQGA